MGKPKKILLVDDEPDILEFVRYNLEKEGYNVRTALNGKDAIQMAEENIPHLIVLDVMMPEMDGIETCTVLREIESLNNTMIAFLTARNEDYSLIAGLEAGGDDYITKPIKPKVLVSRVKALLRRADKGEEDRSVIIAGDLRIDKNTFTCEVKGSSLDLPKKEFELLYYLVSKPGRVFTREEILSRVWGDDVVVGDRTIDVHIRKLREKIGDDFIKTVKGVGYKFEF